MDRFDPVRTGGLILRNRVFTAPFDPIGGVSATCDVLVRSDVAGSIHASSGSVDTWDDQTVNARNMTATTTARPTTGTRTVNGVNVLDFDGTTDVIKTGSFSRAKPYTFVCVFGFDTADRDGTLIGSNTGAQVNFGQASTGAGQYHVGGSATSADAGATDTGAHIAVIKNVGINVSFWIDGVNTLVAQTTGSGANITGGIRLGTNAPNNSWHDGWIASGALYGADMSDADRDYLEAGWGAIFGFSVT